MNHLEDSDTGPLLQQGFPYTKEQRVISTITLLILGYYAVSFFDAWPSTIKRSIYELIIYAIPSRFIFAVQYVMMRLGRVIDHDAILRREDFGNAKRKEDALRHLFGQTAIPTVFRRARSMSGYDKLTPATGETKPAGLGNWDNSCYQNSVLQGLASLPAFQAYIHRSLQLCQKTGSSDSTTSAMATLIDQLADSNGSRTILWTPGVLKSMNSWQQQDAQEYFSRLSDAVESEAIHYTKVLMKQVTPGLDCLRDNMDESSSVSRTNACEDVPAPVKKFLQTVVNNPMDGLQAQALECQTCRYSEGVSMTQFNCLTLNLGVEGHCRLEDLLDAYTDPEMIDGVECDRCTELEKGSPDDASEAKSRDSNQPNERKAAKKAVLRTKAKQITMGRLPKDLVIHVNRSIFDDFGNQRKNTSYIRFPIKLDFSGRWCAPINTESEEVQAVYELKCIVTHQGRHDNGHYVAYGKRDKDWYCFNDEVVTKLTEEDILSRGNVFMLFYEMTEATELVFSDTVESIQEERSVSEGTSSTQISSSESTSTAGPKSVSPQVPLPAMRTASGTLDHPNNDDVSGSNVITAV